MDRPMRIEWIQIEYEKVPSIINQREINLKMDPRTVRRIVCKLILRNVRLEEEVD
jgi:hypothetical protein